MRLSVSTLLLTVLLLLAGYITQAEQPTPDDDAAIDALYERFSKAYDQLEPQAVADLYTEDALYLSGGDGPIVQGRSDIANGFQFLARTRDTGGSLDISFRSVDRAIDNNLAYDVGYYRLISKPAQGEPRTSVGKFTVVLKKQNGSWRFHVDSFSNAPVEAFDKALAE